MLNKLLKIKQLNNKKMFNIELFNIYLTFNI